MFTFLTDWFKPRVPSGQGSFKHVSTRSNSNLEMVFEAGYAPPNREMVQLATRVGQSPGPQGSPFLPFIESQQLPTVVGIPRGGYANPGYLVTTPDSNPEQELF